MKDRRYSDGLHQALEAKEGVIVQDESQTLAETTYQNYFRMYDKLAGNDWYSSDRGNGVFRNLWIGV